MIPERGGLEVAPVIAPAQRRQSSQAGEQEGGGLRSTELETRLTVQGRGGWSAWGARLEESTGKTELLGSKDLSLGKYPREQRRTVSAPSAGHGLFPQPENSQSSKRSPQRVLPEQRRQPCPAPPVASPVEGQRVASTE